MINPIYKFEINRDDHPQCYPIWSDKLSKVYEKEGGEEFFRAKLSESLTFTLDDYDFIMAQVFDFRFELTIYISYDLGATWSEYWKGEFWKTDCDINEDDKTIVVTPKVVDEYTDIMGGLEKEYDLIQLAPELAEMFLDKRGMIQIYTPGESVVACFLAGMWWEEQCEPQEDLNELTQKADGKPCFDEMMMLRIAKIANRSDLVPGFSGTAASILTAYEFTNGEYKLSYTYQAAQYGVTQTWTISKNGTNMWQHSENTVSPATPQFPPMTVTLEPIGGSGASGNVVLDLIDSHILGRYICDVETIGNVTTYELSREDFVFDNRNYHRVCGYNFPQSIAVNDRFSSTPTKWGIYQPGQYYVEPYSIYGAEFFPIARSYWGVFSIWFNFPLIDQIYEEQSRKQIKMRNAYPLYSAISVLLGQIDGSVTHQGTSDYSQFLYGLNPITGVSNLHWLITPKSNILVGEYDQPAQTAKVTLRQILDMLRDCFRCYWYIEDGKFKIEHISFFMNGGSYTGTPTVGRDLTVEYVRRNKKKWAFCTSKYAYDKSEMPARYEFGWMDEETQYFNGYPIDIISNYVDKENIKSINISTFSADVDFLMLEPTRASRDGFVLLGAVTPAEENLVTSTTANKALLADGTTATLANYCVCDYIAVNGKNIRAVGSTPFSNPIYVKQCVYDENHTLIRFSTSDDYVYQSGDAYVRFTFDTGFATAYYYYLYLPYYNYQVGTNDHYLQNGLAAFVYLSQFYLFDLPARYYAINGEQGMAYGLQKGKTQTLRFPCYQDPNLLNLIKTNLGNGKIGKISINLSSRSGEATLKYDTE